MQKQKGNIILIISIIIIVVAILGIGGYFAYQKYFVAKTQTQTSGWNTYKNFGVKFQYPKSSRGLTSTEIIMPDSIYIVSGTAVTIYRGAVVLNATSVDGYMPSSQKISVGGKTATEITDSNGLTGGREDVSINFTESGKTISFGPVQIDTSDHTNSQQLKDNLYKIASTFEIYDDSQTSKDIATGWSIYKNYGIEFEYPGTINLSTPNSYGISQIKITVAEQNDSNSGIGSNGCEVMPNNPALRTSQVTINSIKFCLGRAMTANDNTGYPYFYDYTFLKYGKYYTISYSLGSPDPMNSNFIIQQVEKSISTLKFTN